MHYTPKHLTHTIALIAAFISSVTLTGLALGFASHILA